MSDEAHPPDRRRERGARSRRTITRHAVDIASRDGLAGISFGRLADELGISKAGIQTLFRTKEALQLATAETAGEVFAAAVVAPAWTVPEGVPRWEALLDSWIDYAATPLFPGGCFWGANRPEFDSHPGPIRDLLEHQHRAWLNTLTGRLEVIAADGRLRCEDAELAAFQIDAALNAANIALRLGDSGSVAQVRRIAGGLLRPAP
ncbi:TetR/AcrR family transcriptional regulator [Nocardia sp. NPDC003345]